MFCKGSGGTIKDFGVILHGYNMSCKCKYDVRDVDLSNEKHENANVKSNNTNVVCSLQSLNVHNLYIYSGPVLP